MFAFALSLLISINAFASTADVYEPSTKATTTVIFVHGGAWLGGDKKEYASLAPTFTSKGFRFVAMNYRLSHEAKHPAPIEDLNRELVKYDNIYLIGHSAGAHMIAFWSSAYTNAHVRGFIGIEGIYDLPKLVKTWPSYKDGFIAQEFGSDTAKYAAASPALLPMKSKTPWLVVHSEKDELVDVAQSTGFVARLKKEKIPAELILLKNESHFDAATSLRDSSSDCSKAVLKFISTKR